MNILNLIRLTTPFALPRLRCRLRDRLGMSLMELLIVMGVLSTVVAISWPALRRPLNRSYVQTAAQQLQRDLLGTRRAAMESGQVHWFQYQAETGTYYCGVQRQLNGAGSPDIGASPSSPQDDEAERSHDTLDQQFELPEGATFVSRSPVASALTTVTSTRRNAGSDFKSDDAEPQKNETARSRRTDPKPESETVGWSRPLRFYPSGRMESGQISLASLDGYDILVEIQGLAGRVKVHPLQRNDRETAEPSVRDQPSSETGDSKSAPSANSPRRARSE